MRKAILKSAQIGAITGIVASFAYAIIFLIGIELFLPIPDPSVIVIFDVESLDVVFPEILKLSPIWLGVPTSIGLITSVAFGYILAKLNPNRKRYIFICTTLCILVISPIYIIPAIEIIINVPIAELIETINNPMWLYSHQMIMYLLIIATIVVPSIIYVIIGNLVSRYIFDKVGSFIDVHSTFS